jgi:hypothetical protein
MILVTTAVATIPVAATHVVVVIAVSVALVVILLATAGAAENAAKCRVPTRAVRAVYIVVFGATAVTFVPVAVALVVTVVTETIASKGGFIALAITIVVGAVGR